MSVPYGPILVVEDVANIRELLEVTLKFKGYPVVTARNGDEALECIANERPALIITDILMPKLDGFALAYKVRSDPRTRRIPILFVSATYVSLEDKTFAHRLGAVAFLEKPVDTEELLLTVAEILTMGGGQRPKPLGDADFLRCHQERLEEKLKHKDHQIIRAERLLEKVPEEQLPALQAVLDEAISQRKEIKAELGVIRAALDEKASR